MSCEDCGGIHFGSLYCPLTRCQECGKKTDICCSDCRINTGTSVHVCPDTDCLDKHVARLKCDPNPAPLTPPNASPDYGKMLVDEWGILPDLSSQHGRKIWDKTVKLYEEVLKLRAFPPPQARTRDQQQESARQWLKKFEVTPYQIADEPKEEWAYHLLPDQLEKALSDYVEYSRAESAPQEAGTLWRSVKADPPNERGFYLVWPGRKLGHVEVMYRNLHGNWIGPDDVYNGQTHWQNLPKSPSGAERGVPMEGDKK